MDRGKEKFENFRSGEFHPCKNYIIVLVITRIDRNPYYARTSVQVQRILYRVSVAPVVTSRWKSTSSRNVCTHTAGDD